MTAGEAAPGPPDRRLGRRLRWLALGVFVFGLAVAGAVVWRTVKPVVDARRYASVERTIPTAPRLRAGEGETLYRIDATRSSLTYEIQETFAGRPTSKAEGTTRALAGDVAIADQDLTASRVGTIVADIEQFESDNNLRDSRIRQDFLQSHQYPLARFEVDRITGLDGVLQDGTSSTVTLQGTATVKDQKVPVRWKAKAQVDDGELTATATTTVKLSAFDAGPISVAGLVRTEDEVDLTLRLTAVDVATGEVPTELPVEEVAATASNAPSFRTAVLPVLEERCASCHNTGEMAGEHLPLDTAEDAVAISDGIKTVTQTGYMPPWPAAGEGVALAHDPRLSPDELADLAAWAEAGGPLDVDPTTPIRPRKEELGRRPRADVSLRIDAYTGPPDLVDDYRCFVLDPEITTDTLLTGVTFLDDDISQLHHAQVFQISDEQKRYSATKDGADGRPGWSCYGGPDLLGRRPNSLPDQPRQRDVGFAGQPDLVTVWVPGQVPERFPDGTGVMLHEGDALVLQVHYNYAHSRKSDRSGLGLELTEPTADTRAIRIVNPLAPVEIPCAPADADVPLCDRAASLADSTERFDRSSENNESGLLLLCGKTVEELTADFDGQVARSSCVATVPQDGTIIAAMGHMHTIGKTFRFTLEPDSDDPTVLLDIPRWNFHWQMNYWLQEPIEVKAGQKLLMECSWDRSLDPDREPRYITFAEGTEDEMCFGTYSLLPPRRSGS